jgi:hypothetical protein
MALVANERGENKSNCSQWNLLFIGKGMKIEKIYFVQKKVKFLCLHGDSCRIMAKLICMPPYSNKNKSQSKITNFSSLTQVVHSKHLLHTIK